MASTSYDKVKIKGVFPVWRCKAAIEPEATAAKMFAADCSMDTLKIHFEFTFPRHSMLLVNREIRYAGSILQRPRNRALAATLILAMICVHSRHVFFTPYERLRS
jgi:hypothetical protein